MEMIDEIAHAQVGILFESKGNTEHGNPDKYRNRQFFRKREGHGGYRPEHDVQEVHDGHVSHHDHD